MCLTEQIREVVENTQISIKTILNSPILRNNHELDNIVVNKSKIHREIRYFLCIL